MPSHYETKSIEYLASIAESLKVIAESCATGQDRMNALGRHIAESVERRMVDLEKRLDPPPKSQVVQMPQSDGGASEPQPRAATQQPRGGGRPR